ncbi:type II pantothenate kinase [Bacillus sp. BHET2]|uniref:type II pantothenate kinase n=1 Tax=Bacillus sp. BHET2 TaxID=2583818 RepID=UPI00110DAD77|nr:type II pantothenate kinase [Bacillus sp. BHET2]TMU87636.1 type II pantothenate kinase [Bacillus sp. BHET2]
MSVMGIDAGGTLTKIVYKEKGRLHFKVFSSKNHKEIQKWLILLNSNNKLYLTGGKAWKWKETFPQAYIVDEFDSVFKGTEMLLKEEKLELKPFILINIGTGTSFFKIDKNRSARLLGSGLGGGTFMGLGSILTGVSDYIELVSLSGMGKREQVDLLVGDIYEEGHSLIPDNLTAANFGKVSADSQKADKLRALTNMIGETIILLATQAASEHQIKHFVFVGSALEGNRALKEVLMQFQDILSYTAVFPERGSFAGCLGAYHLGIDGVHSQNRQ